MITCKSAAEARAAVAAARKILSTLGVQLHPRKTRIVHVQHGFEFLGYKIKQGKQLRTRPVDRAATVVASLQALAMCPLAQSASGHTVW